MNILILVGLIVVVYWALSTWYVASKQDWD